MKTAWLGLCVAIAALAIVPLSFSTPTPTAQVGVAYTSSCTASGGTAPYTYSISAGALPNGVNLNGSTGAITGTPTATGVFNFTCFVVDSTVSVGISNPADAARRVVARNSAPALNASGSFSITVSPAAPPSPTPVPPSIWMGLMGLGGAGIFSIRQRRRA